LVVFLQDFKSVESTFVPEKIFFVAEKRRFFWLPCMQNDDKGINYLVARRQPSPLVEFEALFATSLGQLTSIPRGCLVHGTHIHVRLQIRHRCILQHRTVMRPFCRGKQLFKDLFYRHHIRNSRRLTTG
jgi:hypothetical protein